MDQLFCQDLFYGLFYGFPFLPFVCFPHDDTPPLNPVYLQPFQVVKWLVLQDSGQLSAGILGARNWACAKYSASSSQSKHH
jgi:hypothetical protein